MTIATEALLVDNLFDDDFLTREAKVRHQSKAQHIAHMRPSIPEYLWVEDIRQLEDVRKLFHPSATLGFDIEANGLNPWFCDTLLWQLSDGEHHVVGDATKVPLRLLLPLLSGRKLIAHNASYEYKTCRVQELELFDFICPMLSYQVAKAGLLESADFKSAGLEWVADQYADIILDKGHQTSFITMKPGDPFTEEQLIYGVNDVRYLNLIWEKQRAELRDKGLYELALFEFSLIPAFGDMELAGLHVHVAQWRKYLEKLAIDHAAAEAKVLIPLGNAYKDALRAEGKRLAEDEAHLFTAQLGFGFDEVPDAATRVVKKFDKAEFNLNSTQQKLKALNQLGIGVKNTRKDTLKDYFKVTKPDDPTYPVLEGLMALSMYEKLRSTYGESFLAKVDPIEECIYTNIFQCGATSTGRCVAASSTVLTHVNGVALSIPIACVKVGDLVYSYDYAHRITLQRVLNVFPSGKRQCLKLTLKGQDAKNPLSRRSLSVTADHQVRMSTGEYRRADKLRIGDALSALHGAALLDLNGGHNPQGLAPLIVESITADDRYVAVYDLEVEDTHNFFANGVSVSNCSSGAPINLQNVPVRGEVGSKFREFFYAPKGSKFIIADYSALEQRIAAHLSLDPTMLRIFTDGLDMHGVSAAGIFKVDYEDMERAGQFDRSIGDWKRKDAGWEIGLQRWLIKHKDVDAEGKTTRVWWEDALTHEEVPDYKPGLSFKSIKYMRDEVAKTCSFAKNYGGGWTTIQRTLKESDEICKRIDAEYTDTYKPMFEYMDRQSQRAVMMGYTLSVMNRRRFYRPTSWDHPDLFPTPERKRLMLMDRLDKVQPTRADRTAFASLSWTKQHLERDARFKEWKLWPEDIGEIEKGFRAEVERQGRNAVVQSSAADITKLAMRNVWRGLYVAGLLKVFGPKKRYIGVQVGACISLQVHDELITRADDPVVERAKKIVEDGMLGAERALIPNVPAGISCHVGTKWSEK